jgi:outer membrane protein assembly factor BamB
MTKRSFSFPIRLRAVPLGIATLLLSGFCFGRTTISLSTAVGPPTTKFQVSGGGFEPSARIDIYFDAADVAVATANNSGVFSKVTISVPSSAQPGNHRVTAVEHDGTTNANATFLVQTDWAEFHFGNMQRWKQYENTLSTANASNLTLKWGQAVPGAFYSAPAVAAGVVYVASNVQGDSGGVYALDANTGHVLWNYLMGTYTNGSAAVANGGVYIGTAQGDMLVLNAVTGLLLWDFNTGSSIESAATVVKGVVYFGADNGTVYALNAKTGAQLWSYPTSGPFMDSSPAVVGGAVYFGSSDFSIYVLDASTGAKLWSYATGGQVLSSPAVANGVVYVGSQDGNLYALNASTGALIWLYPANASPAVADGTVYSTIGESIIALNASTGALMWTSSPLNWYPTPPAVANGVVYAASYDGNVYAFDASTGAQLWDGVGFYEIATPVTVADGVVYVGSASSMVYVYGLK